MSKKGPLGTAECFYVEEKYKSGMSIEEISQNLDRSLNMIQKYIDSNNIKAKSETLMQQQFVKQRGAVIMTENASSMIDSKRKLNGQKGDSNCITSIKSQ